MDRSEFLKRAGAGTAGLMLASFASGWRSAAAQASKPNVLLVMTDDQPYHTIEVMESLQNRVVAAGMRFDNGYVATPVCGPARGSVLTGKWSHNTGLEKTKGAWRLLPSCARDAEFRETAELGSLPSTAGGMSAGFRDRGIAGGRPRLVDSGALSDFARGGPGRWRGPFSAVRESHVSRFTRVSGEPC